VRNRLAASAAIAFLFPASAAVAGTTGVVRGTVADAAKAAPGVAVSLTGDGANLRVTTGASGAFLFSQVPFGHYTLRVDRTGAAPFTQALDVETDSVVTLPIDLALRTIGKAHVASIKGPGANPVAVTTLSRSQIATLPNGQSLDALITTLPGIVSFSYGEPVAHGFHGLTYELDGVPLPRGTSANFSEVIDPRDIDSLEVFTGAFPAEFGGSRQGAVVNIITRRATDLTAPESGSLTLGGATYGSAQTSLDESVRVGNTRVFLNGNLERTNRGIDSPTFVPVNDRSNQSNEFLRTITNIGKTDSLAFDLSNNFAQFQIPINETVNPNDPVLQVPGTDDVQREYDRFVNLVYTNNAKNGDSYTQIAPWYHDDRVVYAGDLPSDLLGTIDNGDGTFTGLDGLAEDRRSTFLGVRLTHFHTFGPNAVKAGIDASNEFFVGNERIAYLDQNGALQNFFDNQRQRGSQFGAYIQDKWTPTSALAVSGGLRFDHSTGYVAGAQLSPRIEIDGQVGPRDVLHAYYGSLYAAPSLEDTRRAAVVLSGDTGATQPVYDLQPEHDQYYEFGVAHTISPNSRATANFWKRNVRNVLDTTQLANTPIQAVYNNTIGIAKGFDVRVDSRYRNGDTAFVSASLSSSRAGGISGSTFLFAPPGSNPTTVASNLDVTLQPEDHDQTFSATIDYTKRLGTDRSYFASLEPQYGTGYPVAFQNGEGRLTPHLTFDASFGRDALRDTNHPRYGFVADFTNFTNYPYLIKVNNGFNTTQWGAGFKAGLRLIAPF